MCSSTSFHTSNHSIWWRYPPYLNIAPIPLILLLRKSAFHCYKHYVYHHCLHKIITMAVVMIPSFTMEISITTTHNTIMPQLSYLLFLPVCLPLTQTHNYPYFPNPKLHIINKGRSAVYCLFRIRAGGSAATIYGCHNSLSSSYEGFEIHIEIIFLPVQLSVPFFQCYYIIPFIVSACSTTRGWELFAENYNPFLSNHWNPPSPCCPLESQGIYIAPLCGVLGKTCKLLH